MVSISYQSLDQSLISTCIINCSVRLGDIGSPKPSILAQGPTSEKESPLSACRTWPDPLHMSVIRYDCSVKVSGALVSLLRLSPSFWTPLLLYDVTRGHFCWTTSDRNSLWISIERLNIRNLRRCYSYIIANLIRCVIVVLGHVAHVTLDHNGLG